MALRDAFLVLALVLATACTVEETRQWIVSSPIAGVNGIECRVLAGGCDGTEVLHTTTFCATGGAGAAPSGLVDGQRYGYYCLATDCCGGDVAQGCTEVVHPPAGDVRVVMDDPIEEACDSCTSPCSGVRADGGGLDAPGTGGPDGSVDAPSDVVVPTTCVPGPPGTVTGCPLTHVCTICGSGGDARCELGCTDSAGCVAGDECKWLHEGRACCAEGSGAPADPCAAHEDCGQEQACASTTDRFGAPLRLCARVSCMSSSDCIPDTPAPQVCVPLQATNHCLPSCAGGTACPSTLACDAGVCAP